MAGMVSDESKDGLPAWSTPLDGVHVLVVDDDPDTLDLTARILERCKARVTTATSAEEGLDLLGLERPDVVLSDIGMAGMNGYDFVRQIRAMPREQGGNIPAAAFSAFVQSEGRRKAMVAGFDYHVAKPVLPAELVAVVARLARRR